MVKKGGESGVDEEGGHHAKKKRLDGTLSYTLSGNPALREHEGKTGERGKKLKQKGKPRVISRTLEPLI